MTHSQTNRQTHSKPACPRHQTQHHPTFLSWELQSLAATWNESCLTLEPMQVWQDKTGPSLKWTKPSKCWKYSGMASLTTQWKEPPKFDFALSLGKYPIIVRCDIKTNHIKKVERWARDHDKITSLTIVQAWSPSVTSFFQPCKFDRMLMLVLNARKKLAQSSQSSQVISLTINLKRDITSLTSQWKFPSLTSDCSHPSLKSNTQGNQLLLTMPSPTSPVAQPGTGSKAVRHTIHQRA